MVDGKKMFGGQLVRPFDQNFLAAASFDSRSGHAVRRSPKSEWAARPDEFSRRTPGSECCKREPVRLPGRIQALCRPALRLGEWGEGPQTPASVRDRAEEARAASAAGAPSAPEPRRAEAVRRPPPIKKFAPCNLILFVPCGDLLLRLAGDRRKSQRGCVLRVPSG